MMTFWHFIMIIHFTIYSFHVYRQYVRCKHQILIYQHGCKLSYMDKILWWCTWQLTKFQIQPRRQLQPLPSLPFDSVKLVCARARKEYCEYQRKFLFIGKHKLNNDNSHTSYLRVALNAWIMSHCASRCFSNGWFAKRTAVTLMAIIQLMKAIYGDWSNKGVYNSNTIIQICFLSIVFS